MVVIWYVHRSPKPLVFFLWNFFFGGESLISYFAAKEEKRNKEEEEDEEEEEEERARKRKKRGRGNVPGVKLSRTRVEDKC